MLLTQGLQVVRTVLGIFDNPNINYQASSGEMDGKHHLSIDHEPRSRNSKSGKHLCLAGFDDEATLGTKVSVVVRDSSI